MHVYAQIMLTIMHGSPNILPSGNANQNLVAFIAAFEVMLPAL